MEWEERPILRSMTCWQCKHLKDVKGERVGFPEKSLCDITRHWGLLQRGNYCEHFEYRQWHNAVAEDGTPIKNRQGKDYRTERQWENVGRRIKPDAVGAEMYANRHNMTTKYKYYLIEDTEEIQQCQK